MENEINAVRLLATKLRTVAAVVEKMDGLLDESVYVWANTENIYICPNDDKQARRVVGSLIRKFEMKPSIAKAWDNKTLEASFNYGGVTVQVQKYRGRKCATVTKTIVHEAEPEKVIPAKEAWVETKEEIVCEIGAVESELDSVQTKQEVPF